MRRMMSYIVYIPPPPAEHHGAPLVDGSLYFPAASGVRLFSTLLTGSIVTGPDKLFALGTCVCWCVCVLVCVCVGVCACFLFFVVGIVRADRLTNENTSACTGEIADTLCVCGLCVWLVCVAVSPRRDAAAGTAHLPAPGLRAGAAAAATATGAARCGRLPDDGLAALEARQRSPADKGARHSRTPGVQIRGE